MKKHDAKNRSHSTQKSNGIQSNQGDGDQPVHRPPESNPEPPTLDPTLKNQHKFGSNTPNSPA